jgi:hypothetical protein
MAINTTGRNIENRPLNDSEISSADFKTGNEAAERRGPTEAKSTSANIEDKLFIDPSISTDAKKSLENVDANRTNPDSTKVIEDLNQFLSGGELSADLSKVMDEANQIFGSNTKPNSENPQALN